MCRSFSLSQAALHPRRSPSVLARRIFAALPHHRKLTFSSPLSSSFMFPLNLNWFIYTFLGLGVAFCVVTCSGHAAAETANGCCLYLYMVFVVFLLMLEAAITIDVFVNRDWEKDFPKDPSGSFDRFKNCIRTNFEMCKWIGLSLVSVQGLSLLLAMILKALGPHQYYDSDDEYTTDTVPLLKNAPPYVVDHGYGHGPNNDVWIRVSDKMKEE